MAASRSALSVRTRTLALFCAHLAAQDRHLAFALMRRSIHQRSLPRAFFREILIHTSLFLGYPVMLDGLEVLSATAKRTATGKSGWLTPGSARAAGLRNLQRVYGAQTAKLLRHLKRLEPSLARRVMEEAYGRVMSRAGLSLAERELINVVVLFMQSYDRQLFSHLRGALNNGVSPDALRAVLQLAASGTMLDTTSAFEAIERINRSIVRGSF